MYQDLVAVDAHPPEPASGYLDPGHLAAARWVAHPELLVGPQAAWQDVSLRPEGGGVGFTVELCTTEVLEQDHENAAGPHPREKLPAGEGIALDVGRMAVYLARPFTRMEALACSEALLVEAGVSVISLKEVSRRDFYGGLTERRPS